MASRVQSSKGSWVIGSQVQAGIEKAGREVRAFRSESKASLEATLIVVESFRISSFLRLV